jgi:hypothetical protein
MMDVVIDFRSSDLARSSFALGRRIMQSRGDVIFRRHSGAILKNVIISISLTHEFQSIPHAYLAECDLRHVG